MLVSLEAGFVAVIVTVLLLIWQKPSFCFHGNGEVKSYGIGLDGDDRCKTLFTPLMVAALVFVTVVTLVTRVDRLLLKA